MSCLHFIVAASPYRHRLASLIRTASVPRRSLPPNSRLLAIIRKAPDFAVPLSNRALSSEQKQGAHQYSTGGAEA